MLQQRLSKCSEHIHFDDLSYVVIDEADTLMSPPFVDDLKSIIAPLRVLFD